ncbi:putative enzyme related to lactoylglutathione lyase [Dokdonella fugitiva]|jgi:catechol 2,3-dioxygenase-like lactoylglutathione lyase family enzyme|uniref:Putative enzyme related to lactoylglutathione lyase n=2 Tax=Dokdonella fugitiva TaxID=328517 RepID=A0A4R2I1D8_9GAMM|nr:catechol 2,3-dioxygenase-like lactoylglutathione lyase family enzyme [Dokdonella fugitiva]TCO37732.1 putative enzyme related to lactoylglutathione lyase [Dokdonella fugitiva]
MMHRRVAQVALLVRDYDEAIAWYADALGFVLVEDTDLGGGKRWVRIAPAGDAAFTLLLARAANERQLAAVGDQHGGRVGWFLHSDDFARDHARLAAAGARFDGPPRHEAYGTVVVFSDLYGNRWDLIGPCA